MCHTGEGQGDKALGSPPPVIQSNSFLILVYTSVLHKVLYGKKKEWVGETVLLLQKLTENIYQIYYRRTNKVGTLGKD